MARTGLRRLVPDRLTPVLLLAGGRPEAAADRLGVNDTRGDLHALHQRIDALEATVAKRDAEIAAMLDYLDRNLGALEAKLDEAD